MNQPLDHKLLRFSEACICLGIARFLSEQITRKNLTSVFLKNKFKKHFVLFCKKIKEN